ncbi:MAG TPA: IS66 family insertion sequence element accessory protein TnpB [Anaeromyxobacteraceae bacterium]|nr:IS66 family insertion sequence element accessory protein TnpB [Anaeromyxobacteraceae bacterium]
MAADRERWTRLVADFESSDLSQREFANERGISFSNLRYWIYRLRKEARPLTTDEPVSSPVEPAETKPRLTFRPVRVVASATKSRSGEAEVAHLELVLSSGARLRFPAGTDLAYLRALAAAL